MATNAVLEADARPTKQFFIENLTRDLSLEDAILDLVDNAIDALIRTRHILMCRRRSYSNLLLRKCLSSFGCG